MADRTKLVYEALCKVDAIDQTWEEFIDRENRPYSSRKNKNRTIRKDELILMCERLGIDPAPTKKEMRTQVRALFPNTGKTKPGDYRFGNTELRRLNGRLKDAARLRPDDLPPTLYEDLKAFDTLEINGTKFRFIEKFRSAWKDHWGSPPRYERYEYYRLTAESKERKHRLMVLHGLDTSECVYHAPVVLERKCDYGPYERWTKVAYVTEFERC